MFESQEARKQHRQLVRQAQNRRYKENIRNDSSRASVLAKAKATSLRGKVKRFGDYNIIAPRFAVLSQELRALHAGVNGDVAAIAELKSSWDDLEVKG